MVSGLHEKNIFSDVYPFRLIVNTSENYSCPPHWHNASEIIYPTKNSLLVNVNGQEHFLQEREILFISGGDVHCFTINNSAGIRYVLQFDITALDIFNNLSPANSSLLHTHVISPVNTSSLHTQVEFHLSKIIGEYMQKFIFYQLSTTAGILDLLVALSRNKIEQTQNPGLHSQNKAPQGIAKLCRAFQYIEENYQNDIFLKDVSAAAGFSEYHFSRIFKKTTGQSFHEYLTARRINRAEILLSTYDLSIIEVAHASGFSSIPTFNRTFKKVNGCTPMEYKRRQLLY